VIDEKTGEVLAECNEDVEAELLARSVTRVWRSFKILFIDNLNVGPYLRATLNLELSDRRRGRTGGEEGGDGHDGRGDHGDLPPPPPGRAADGDTARNLFNNLFFNPERYDLSRSAA
jgi:DNA-directed RNA polymerase subunit beta